LSDIKENYSFGQIFLKSSHVKFHKNASSGRQVVPCGQIDRRKDGVTDGQTDMAKIIIAFFANLGTHIKTARLIEFDVCRTVHRNIFL